MPDIDLFDTHCHIHEMVRRTTPVYDKWYEDATKREQAGEPVRTPQSVITAAHEAGVNRMLCIGTTLADSELAVEFVGEREDVWASIGIHPHEAADHQSLDAKKRFAALLGDSPSRRSIVAIGECGLDYFYGHSP